jgi:hypothetical protein
MEIEIKIDNTDALAKRQSKRDEHKQRLHEMRYGRIPREYLTNLVLDYKAKRNLMPDYKMPSELADVVLLIIDKMLGASSWRGYTEDWKEEMRGKAIEHILNYAHNFDREKMNNGKGDPYNYFAMIIHHAFVQTLKKLKKHAEINVAMNHEVMYENIEEGDNDSLSEYSSLNVDSIDYGGVTTDITQ